MTIILEFDALFGEFLSSWAINDRPLQAFHLGVAERSSKKDILPDAEEFVPGRFPFENLQRNADVFERDLASVGNAHGCDDGSGRPTCER